jgi:YfiR/HmsC-like
MAVLKYGVALALIAALQSGSSQAPETLTEPQVKAAVLYNLARFVEWPAESLTADKNLNIAVIRADSVLAAMRSVDGRVANGRTVRVHQLLPGDEPRSCHIIYIAELDREGKAWLEKLQRRPILTVSDDEQFLRAGGIIRLSFEQSHVRFDIDVGHAERARLRISSKVLSLARVVRDGRSVK